MTSGEKGETMTIACAVSATGIFVLPLLVLSENARQNYCCEEALQGQLAAVALMAGLTLLCLKDG